MTRAGSDRLKALRRILSQGEMSSQEELREKLLALKFDVTQSTISRDLRRLGAIRALDPKKGMVYRLLENATDSVVTSSSLQDLILDINANQAMIVIHTQPGSASLVARHLDQLRPGKILGTIAGDDTIFVAPSSLNNLKACIREIEESFT